LDLLAKKGERVVMPAAIAAGMVYFTSFAPNSEPCRSGGESFFYAVSYDEGIAPAEEDERGQAMTRFRGGGIASRPVLDIVNGTVIVQNSNQTITIVDIGIEYSPLTVKSWQEDFEDAVQAVEDADDGVGGTGE
jgi:Tfp pilus tip-associated adhesin PilY1